ncbi:hypothetical protein JNW91_30780, partial [Micromonospora sp. STR1_7]|nr:hypothetical protein [Micromonospora parastrephiae]
MTPDGSSTPTPRAVLAERQAELVAALVAGGRAAGGVRAGAAGRPYRIEANALGAGREHTRTEHPEQYTGEQEDL